MCELGSWVPRSRPLWVSLQLFVGLWRKSPALLRQGPAGSSLPLRETYSMQEAVSVDVEGVSAAQQSVPRYGDRELCGDGIPRELKPPKHCAPAKR